LSALPNWLPRARAARSVSGQALPRLRAWKVLLHARSESRLRPCRSTRATCCTQSRACPECRGTRGTSAPQRARSSGRGPAPGSGSTRVHHDRIPRSATAGAIAGGPAARSDTAVGASRTSSDSSRRRSVGTGCRASSSSAARRRHADGHGREVGGTGTAQRAGPRQEFLRQGPCGACSLRREVAAEAESLRAVPES